MLFLCKWKGQELETAVTVARTAGCYGDRDLILAESSEAWSWWVKSQQGKRKGISKLPWLWFTAPCNHLYLLVNVFPLRRGEISLQLSFKTRFSGLRFARHSSVQLSNLVNPPLDAAPKQCFAGFWDGESHFQSAAAVFDVRHKKRVWSIQRKVRRVNVWDQIPKAGRKLSNLKKQIRTEATTYFIVLFCFFLWPCPQKHSR